MSEKTLKKKSKYITKNKHINCSDKPDQGIPPFIGFFFFKTVKSINRGLWPFLGGIRVILLPSVHSCGLTSSINTRRSNGQCSSSRNRCGDAPSCSSFRTAFGCQLTFIGTGMRKVELGRKYKMQI